MRKILIFCTALCLTAAMSTTACANPGDVQIQSKSEASPMKIVFNTDASVQAWKSVNDGVMGGRSSGNARFEDGAMVFQGVINTNGGGFASMRTDMQPGALSDVSAITLRVKSDGRAYKLTFRTNARARWRPVSFQGLIPVTPKGEWSEVTIPLDMLETSVFGRLVIGAEFDKGEVKEMGIILADGIDGPFKLEVASMTGE